jgi:hypothetical protein
MTIYRTYFPPVYNIQPTSLHKAVSRPSLYANTRTISVIRELLSLDNKRGSVSSLFRSYEYINFFWKGDGGLSLLLYMQALPVAPSAL